MASVSGANHGAPDRGEYRDDRDRCFWERVTFLPEKVRWSLKRRVSRALGEELSGTPPGETSEE